MYKRIIYIIKKIRTVVSNSPKQNDTVFNGKNKKYIVKSIIIYIRVRMRYLKYIRKVRVYTPAVGHHLVQKSHSSTRYK